MMVPQHLSATVRRTQILDAAHRLFLSKGYEATTIEDVLNAVGIAKGTLYHHFPGKEAILDAIVMRTTDAIGERADSAARDASQPAAARFLAVVAAARAPEEDIELAQQLRLSGNLRFHIMAMTESYARLVPVLTRVVEEGVAAGELSTPDPRGSVEVILAAGLTLLDGGIFPPMTEEDEACAAQRRAALARTAVLLLGADPATMTIPAPDADDAPAATARRPRPAAVPAGADGEPEDSPRLMAAVGEVPGPPAARLG